MGDSFKTKCGSTLPIMNIKGKEYLQVAHRLVWFREEHPDWSIETEIIDRGKDFCLSKAYIKDQNGRVISDSIKYEDASGFKDFIEKSSTGAIGRALALCGYGTQFTAWELDEGERLADSPTPPPKSMSDRVKNMNPQLKEILEKPQASPPKEEVPWPTEDMPAAHSSPAKGAVIGFGKNKGVPITDLNDKQLQWYQENYAKNAMDPDKSRFKEENQRMAEICMAEMVHRSQKAPPPFDAGEQIPF